MGGLLQPSSLLLLCLAAIALTFGVRGARRRWQRRAILVATAVIAALALSPLSDLLLAPLERRFPPLEAGQIPTGAPTIVVLGGVSRLIDLEGRSQPEFSAAIDRVTYAADLANRLPASRILICAGTADSTDEKDAEAYSIAALLERLGIGRERLLAETGSTSTAANARNAMAFLKPGEKVVLVTSAFHMPRAVGAFRAQGLNVVPAPTDWRLEGEPQAWTRPASDGFSTFDMAVHEYVGLVLYWVRGDSRELFPGPADNP